MGIQVNKMNSGYQQNFGANYKVEIANATKEQLHKAAFLNKYAENCKENLELLQKLKPELKPEQKSIKMSFPESLDETAKFILDDAKLNYEEIPVPVKKMPDHFEAVA